MPVAFLQGWFWDKVARGLRCETAKLPYFYTVSKSRFVAAQYNHVDLARIGPQSHTLPRRRIVTVPLASTYRLKCLGGQRAV